MIEVRKIKVWEIPKLLRFRDENDYKSRYDRATSESPLYYLLKIVWHRDRLATFVAVQSGEIIGYLSLAFGKHREFKGNAYFINAAVKESERGKGVGTSLFRAVENYSQSRGTRRVEFEVFGQNTGALKLYKQLGYEVEGVKRKAVEKNGEYDDLILLAKFL